MRIGELVVYVPSHDAEYNNQPGLGVVVSVYNDRIGIRPNQYPDRIYEIKREYVAALSDAEGILQLIRRMNDMVLNFQGLLYLCEIHLDFNKKLWLYKQIRVPKYHIG